MNVKNCVPLPQLSRALSDLAGPGVSVPGYRRLHMLALDGQIRTVLVNGRHHVPQPDLPEIARMLGLSVPEAAPRAVAHAEHASAA